MTDSRLPVLLPGRTPGPHGPHSPNGPADPGHPGLRRLARLSRLGVLGAALAAAGLAGCSSSPPQQLYQLRAEAPADGLPPPPAPAANAPVWTIGPISLPEYLDRDAILRPQGQAGLGALPLQRWAEPLRDAVPRILRQDLARLRGVDKVWAAPAPPGVNAEWQLRVEIQQFEAAADGRSVVLQARWWLQDPAGRLPVVVRERRLSVGIGGAGPDELVAAHRALLGVLARVIAEGG